MVNFTKKMLFQSEKTSHHCLLQNLDIESFELLRILNLNEFSSIDTCILQER